MTTRNIDTPPIPATVTLTAAAELFAFARSTLSAWRATDKRFPKPNAEGRFKTLAIFSFIEIHELERADACDIREERRAGAENLERELARGTFGGRTRILKKIIAGMKAEDPEDYRRERIAELEAYLAEGDAPERKAYLRQSLKPSKPPRK